MTYIKWTQELTTKARFLLTAFKSYEKVSKLLKISKTALKSRNNKYWKINCHVKWNELNDMQLLSLLKDGISRKEIAKVFNTTKEAISIRISQLSKEK